MCEPLSMNSSPSQLALPPSSWPGWKKSDFKKNWEVKNRYQVLQSLCVGLEMNRKKKFEGIWLRRKQINHFGFHLFSIFRSRIAWVEQIKFFGEGKRNCENFHDFSITRIHNSTIPAFVCVCCTSRCVGKRASWFRGRFLLPSSRRPSANTSSIGRIFVCLSKKRGWINTT